jgi:hypothetical protein
MKRPMIKNKPFFFLLPFAFCLLTLLTGCVRYEVGVNFEDQHHGAIVQHIRLGQQLTTLSTAEATKWLNSIERRATQLQGKSDRISPQEIIVTIPFGNGRELAQKFNEFFKSDASSPTQSLTTENLDLVQLESEMAVKQSNWLLVERNLLDLNVDLRALGVLSNQGNIIVSPGSLIDLEFVLNTPWGARSLVGENVLTPDVGESNRQLIWHLQPGQINTIKVAFWLPNLLGLGTIAIAILMVIGFYLKYKRLPLLEQPQG